MQYYKNMLHQLRKYAESPVGNSVQVKDRRAIAKFVNDPGNTFLVSFPRTGSHWLRMIMELYFERPSLVLVFYYPERKDYLTLHTHDLDLDTRRSHAIYLYRDPVDTIYSQLNYYREGMDDVERIVHWSALYGKHLDKWLCEERFTKRKTVITYENLKHHLADEFAKIADHFSLPLDAERLRGAAARVSKQEVQSKTTHDTRVVQVAEGYENAREIFRERQGERVWKTVLEGRGYLAEYFAKEDHPELGDRKFIQ